MKKGTFLNPKQRRFISEYLKDQNGTQAAIRAGYSKKTAQVQSSDLLSKPMIANAIELALKKISADAFVDATFVLTGLKKNAIRCQQGEPVVDHDGKPTGEWKFDSAGSNRAFELIGRTMGMFVDKVEAKEEGEIIVNVMPAQVSDANNPSKGD